MSKSVASCVSYCVAGNAYCGTTTAREAWKTVGSEWDSYSQGVKKFTGSRKLGTRSWFCLGFHFDPTPPPAIHANANRGGWGPGGARIAPGPVSVYQWSRARSQCTLHGWRPVTSPRDFPEEVFLDTGALRNYPGQGLRGEDPKAGPGGGIY